jgi:hypothetical protein
MKSQSSDLRVCPNCGNPNLRGSFTLGPSELSFISSNNKMITGVMQNPDFFACLKCSYYGPPAIIPKSKLKSFQKSVKPFTKKAWAQKPAGINASSAWKKTIAGLELGSFALGLIGGAFLLFELETIALPLEITALCGFALAAALYLIWFVKNMQSKKK